MKRSHSGRQQHEQALPTLPVLAPAPSIPALSRTKGFTGIFMPLAGKMSPSAAAFSFPLPSVSLLLTFMEKGLEGEARENTMN